MSFPKSKPKPVSKTTPELNPKQFNPDVGLKKPAGPRAPVRAQADPGMLIPADLKAAALDKLGECLRATRRYWNKDAKTWDVEADFQTALRSIELILAYGEGRPVERRIELSLKGESWEEQRDRAMTSPEGVRFLLAAGAISREQADAALAELAFGCKTTPE